MAIAEVEEKTGVEHPSRLRACSTRYSMVLGLSSPRLQHNCDTPRFCTFNSIGTMSESTAKHRKEDAPLGDHVSCARSLTRDYSNNSFNTIIMRLVSSKLPF